jgi:hypothetical protein
MNRRGFLTAIAATLAGAALDPEKLLWEPGKKLISIPNPVFADAGLRYFGLMLDLSQQNPRNLITLVNISSFPKRAISSRPARVPFSLRVAT